MKREKKPRFQISDRNRYLFSYLVVFVLPLVLLLSIGYYGVRNYMLHEIEQNNRDELRYMILQIEKEINVLKNTTILFSETPEFYTYHLQRESASFYEVCEQIQKQRFANNSVSDLFVYNKTTGKIYTHDCVYPVDRYFALHSFFDSSRIREILDSDLQLSILFNERKDTFSGRVLYITPLEYSAESTISFVCYVFNPDVFLTPPILSEDNMSLLLTADEPIFFDNGMEMPAETDWMQKEYPDGWFEGVFFQTEEGSILKGVSIFSQDYIKSKLFTLRLVFLLIAVLMIPLGAVLISTSMKISFHPLTQLFQLVLSAGQGDREKSSSDSISSVQNFLSELVKQNKEMQRQSLALIREKLLFDLIRGNEPEGQALDRELKNAQLTFSGEVFRTIILQLEDDFSVLHSPQLYQLLEENLSAPSLYLVEYLEENRILLLLSATKELNDELSSTLTLLSETIRKQIGLNVVWGVGGNASNLHGYHTSYLQAREALKYKLLRSRTVFFYQETSAKQRDFQYPHDELQAFYNSILSIDSNKMQLSLNAITEQIEKVPTLFIGTSLFYDILNTAMKASFELDHNLGNIFHLLPELSEKSEIHSPSEILELVDSIIQRLICHVEQTVPSRTAVKAENITIESIEQFMNDNFKDPNFSLQTLAGHFGMSMSNLSHYFKSHAGISLIDSLTEKKIAYTKELLITTDDTINDIVQKMGYMHPSNFIKKFKNIVGMTPGKYREIHKSSKRE